MSKRLAGNVVGVLVGEKKNAYQNLVSTPELSA
jgi:hypothetical protein